MKTWEIEIRRLVHFEQHAIIKVQAETDLGARDRAKLLGTVEDPLLVTAYGPAKKYKQVSVKVLGCREVMKPYDPGTADVPMEIKLKIGKGKRL